MRKFITHNMSLYAKSGNGGIINHLNACGPSGLDQQQFSDGILQRFNTPVDTNAISKIFQDFFSVTQAVYAWQQTR